MGSVFDLSYKLLAIGQLKDHIPGVPKCEDGEEESEKEQSQNIYKAGGLHLMGIGADGHGGARAILWKCNDVGALIWGQSLQICKKKIQPPFLFARACVLLDIIPLLKKDLA